MSQVEESARKHPDKKKLGYQPKEARELKDIRIIAGAFERIGNQGPYREPGNEELFNMLDKARSLSNLGDASATQEPTVRTSQVLMVPVETLDPQIKKARGSWAKNLINSLLSSSSSPSDQPKWEARDAAVCFSVGARNDSATWEEQIRGIAIMPLESVTAFYKELTADPTSLFDLIRIVNKGPVRSEDGSPVPLLPGEYVAVLPNRKLGGVLEHQVNSKPFPRT